MPRLSPLWPEIVAAERAELFASPERVAWILERYDPEREAGRAVLYMPGPDRSARRKTNKPHRDQGEPRAAWRRTDEFEGDEDALIEEREAA